MAKIYRVIHIKIGAVSLRKCHMITDLPKSVFKRHHSDKYFSEFYLQDGGKHRPA